MGITRAPESPPPRTSEGGILSPGGLRRRGPPTPDPQSGRGGVAGWSPRLEGELEWWGGCRRGGCVPPPPRRPAGGEDIERGDGEQALLYAAPGGLGSGDCGGIVRSLDCRLSERIVVVCLYCQYVIVVVLYPFDRCMSVLLFYCLIVWLCVFLLDDCQCVYVLLLYLYVVVYDCCDLFICLIFLY